MSIDSYSKIKVVPNMNYQRSGPKSYVYLLQKWGFQPTHPGPYVHIDKVVRQEFGFGFMKKILGKTRTDSVLAKKEGPEGATAAAPREVPTQDMQYDSIYLSEVYIGTPPRKLLLNFDTGSADTWVRYSSIHMRCLLIQARSGPPNFPPASRKLPDTLSLTPKNLPHSSLRRTRLGKSHMATTPLRLGLLAPIM